MKPILTSEAMQRADRLTIEQFGIPNFALMESAGRAAAHSILAHEKPQSAVILCGKGNNGGDGLVIGRVLHAHNVSVTIVFVGDRTKATKETKQNLELIEALQHYEGRNKPQYEQQYESKLEHKSEHKPTQSRLSLHFYTQTNQLAALPKPDIWIDALLGTGLNSDVRAPIEDILTWLNQQPEPKVAIDVPSGINATTGDVCGVALRATRTITMAAIKTGLLLEDAPDFTGKMEVVEIGIPRFILEDVTKREGGTWQVEEADIHDWLPVRAHRANKYSVGYLLAFLGSEGMTGAATMATMAAERIGAGGVVCACPASIQPILAQKLTTAMPFALPETNTGIDDASSSLLEPHIAKSRALLVGCGIGRKPKTQQFVRDFLVHAQKPSVIDADALHAFIGHTDLFAQHANAQWILTPHWGEFKRLIPTQSNSKEISEKDRLNLARQYAKQWNCVILLKGFPSIIATPKGDVWLNPTGNAAAATAGTGDVLAGTCAGLLAQGMTAERAAIAAIYLCGKAADQYCQFHPAASMIATDLLLNPKSLSR